MSIFSFKFMQFAMITATLFVSTICNAAVVVVDASQGSGDDVQVQAAVDAAAKGTILQLKGTFVFQNPVNLYKSKLTITGDYEDLNGNGKPDVDDYWGTEIGTTVPTGYANVVAFQLLPQNGDQSAEYHVKNLRLSDIKFTAGNTLLALDGQAIGCSDPLIPNSLKRLVVENNWIDEGHIRITKNFTKVEIDNNLFTSRLSGIHDFHHNVELVGATVKTGCPSGDPSATVYELQKNNSITNNVFLDNTSLSFSAQSKGEISGNTFKSYATPGEGPRPDFVPKIEPIQLSKVDISDNHIESYGGVGIRLWSSGSGDLINQPIPGVFSEKINIKDNTIIGTRDGVIIIGGISKSSIKGNHFSQHSGTTGNSAVLVFDNAVGYTGILFLVNPSSKFDIKDNDIEGMAYAGILLNGETTGVTLKNNAFSANSGPDVLLAPFDLFSVSGTECPAQGNEVISKKGITNVLDYYPISQDCGGEPNTFRGNINFLPL